VGVLACDDVDLFSYMEADMTPVVAMLKGLGLRGLEVADSLILTLTEVDMGVSVPLMALGDRPAMGLQNLGHFCYSSSYF
jgi:hypothetical protein